MRIPSQYIISTAEESKEVDTKTSEEFGIDAFTLMEVAGKSAAKIVQSKTKSGSSGLCLCGKGNNGGDALVAARYLAQKGFKITIVFVSSIDNLSPLAQKNYELLKKVIHNDKTLSIDFANNREAFYRNRRPDFIIDGMLGTGLNSALRGDILKAVQWANKQKALCFAMDIPTGLHTDSGKIMEEAIFADHTLVFGTLKQGFYLNDGLNCRGEVHFCELPFPDYLKKSSAYLIDERYLPSLKREPAAHKYAAGVVYIIGGSEGLTGAAIMAAQSAWAAGVGAVILICPRGLLPVFENNLPQIIKKAVGGRNDIFFKSEHVDDVTAIVTQKKGTVLIGPGTGTNESTEQFINQFLKNSESDCVIDADALWALARQDGWQNHHASYILTPHPGELQTLLGEAVGDDQKRLEKVRRMATEKNVTVLSKGYPVIIANNSRETYISPYDSRHFSRAGFGDILAGKVAAFRALGCIESEACMRALLYGEKKMRHLLNENPNYIPEPKDVL